MRIALRLAALILFLPLIAQAGPAPHTVKAPPEGKAGAVPQATAPAADCIAEVPVGCPPDPVDGVCHQRIIITLVDATTGAAIAGAQIVVVVPVANIIVGTTTDANGNAVVDIELPCGVQGVAEIQAISNGVPCAISAEALAGVCMQPTPVRKSSWGKLKVIYR